MYYANGTTVSGIWEDNEYLGEDISSGNPPIITWLTPEYYSSSSSTSNTTVKVCIKSDSELSNSQIYVNNNLQINDAVRGYNVVSSACDFTLERNITLTGGENIIKIVAENDAGTSTSDTRTIVFNAATEQAKFALVIGNGNYSTSPLRNPANDAISMAAELENLGFEVMLYTDISQTEMKRNIRSFGERLIDNPGISLFYFAGHGIQLNGVNYLIPVDAIIEKEQDVELESVSLKRVLGEMEYARTDMNIVILDACRNNPFVRSFRSGGTNGLATTIAPSGTFIAYATAPGSVAADGTVENGLYTQELLKALRVPGLKIEELFKLIRNNVYELSNQQQVPWDNSSIFGDFYFKEK